LNEAEELLDELSNAVVLGDVHKARKIAEQVVNRGISTSDAIEKLTEAMQVADKKYERKECSVMDIVAAASAMREAFKVFEPHLQVKSAQVAGKIVIGSLKGNIQGMGKDIVAATLRTAGFQVVDLDVNVPPETFVDAATQEEAQIIAVSISIDETVPFLKELVSCLQQRKARGKVKIVVGGRAVSEKTCSEYGVDAYAKDAWDCVKKVKGLLTS